MDGLSLIIVIVLFLLFGKSFLASFTGTFTQPNAVPTPDGIPMSTTQNQNNLNTQNAPSPWTPGNCNPQQIALAGTPQSPLPVSQSLPMMQPGINFRAALPSRIRR